MKRFQASRTRSKRNSPTGVKGPQKQKGRSDFSERPFLI
jgi:hypothetical protein